MKVLIMAGGKGTRISSIASDIPKPMVPINGKPVLWYEIDCLKRQGYKDIIITISHLGQIIMNYFGDGRSIGVNIEYFYEIVPLGNAGALFQLKEKLTDDFLLLNADSLFDIDINRFVAFHKQHGGLVSIFTHPNSHPYDSGLIVTDQNDAVVQWLSIEDDRPEWFRNKVNAGIHIISPKILDQKIDTPKIDLDKQLLKPLVGTGMMFAYNSPEYVMDMGTPKRYKAVCKDYFSGLVVKRNLLNKQKAIFLDRDGTINRYVGFLRNLEDFELLPDVADAIKLINVSGYLAIIVTNQPVVARGEVTYDGLNEIHKKMETLLAREGAYLDAIYVCPHHPDRGFEGEVTNLKKECDCRKPKPGMLFKSAEDFNIDLSQSWMIGDSDNDMKAGYSAGCRCIKIDKSTLLKAVKKVLGVC